MPGSASLTHFPAHGVTAELNVPSGPTGLSTGRSSALATSMSSTPKAGARWTMPVPSSVLTKSAATTRWPPSSMGRKSNGRR